MKQRTYGKLHYLRADGEARWVIEAQPHVAMKAKRVFSRISKQEQGHLTLTHTPDICVELLWFLQRFNLEMVPADRRALMAAAASHDKTLAELDAIMAPNYKAPKFKLAKPPRDYQAREAAIWVRTTGVLVADDVGLGKTVSAICGLTDQRLLPCVVVALTHLPKQWQRMVNEFAPSLNVHIIRKGTPYQLPEFMGEGPDVLVINYHKLAGWSDALGKYCKSVVFDEAQELRRNKTDKYNAAAHIASQVGWRLGLSATPIYNMGGEIYNVLDVLKPGCLGSREEFATEWCGGQAYSGLGKNAAPLRNPKAFGAWARDQHLIVRHTRRDVGRELPKVTTITEAVDIDAEPLKAIEGTAAELARIILGRRDVQAERGDVFRASQELSHVMRMATGVAKAPHVADFVRLLVASGEKVVLFGWHHSVYDIWAERLRDLGVVEYTGRRTQTQKEQALQQFIKDRRTGVFMMSLRSGAGLNGLEKVASVVVFGELDWSPGVHEQNIGRVDRDGQGTPVVAYFLVAEEGSDPVVAESLGVKREQVHGLKEPMSDDTVERLQVDPEHVKKLAAHFLKQRGEM